MPNFVKLLVLPTAKKQVQIIPKNVVKNLISQATFKVLNSFEISGEKLPYQEDLHSCRHRHQHPCH